MNIFSKIQEKCFNFDYNPFNQDSRSSTLIKTGIAALGIAVLTGLGYYLSRGFATDASLMRQVTPYPSKTSIFNNICPLDPIKAVQDANLHHDLDNLQTRIDALHWKENLSANPPIPDQIHPIKRKQATNWINAHKCQEQRVIAKKLIDATTHINHEEFEYELKQSVQQFNDWLDTQESKDYILLVTDKASQKSNRWVAELALKHLKSLPTTVVNKAKIYSLDEKYTGINKYLYFDDAAYGCTQTEAFLTTLPYNVPAHQKHNFSIGVVTPFMRDKTCIIPKGEGMYKYEYGKDLLVFNSRKMNTVGDFLTEEEGELIRCSTSKIPFYFDHKIADSWSTCTSIYEFGEVNPNPPKVCTKPEGAIHQINYDKGIKSTKFLDYIEPPYKT